MDFPRSIISPDWSARTSFLPTFGLVLKEAVDLGDSSVEGNYGEAMVGGIQNQVLAHDRKADETEITTGFRLRRANLEVGQSRTKSASRLSMEVPSLNR